METITQKTPAEAQGKIDSFEAIAFGKDAPQWKGINDRPITAKLRFGLMGIINVTPDSFYDGGRHGNTEKTLKWVSHLIKSGADILDIGAESTRPGAEVLSPGKERERLAPVLCAVRNAHPSALISVDTFHAATASMALEAGAQIINDVSALENDPGLLDVLKQYKPGYVLMHNRGIPISRNSYAITANILDEVKKFFEKKMNVLVGAGLPEDHIVLDPGIGFGKNMMENLVLLGRIGQFLNLGRPILVGVSMKSFFGDLLGLPLEERGESTAIASALLWQKGVFWHRVHNVAQVRNALFLAQSLDYPWRHGEMEREDAC